MTRAWGQITTGALDNDDNYEDLFTLMNPPFDGLTMLKIPYSWIIQCDCLATLECARDNACASPLVCRTSVICVVSTTLSAKLARMAISAHAMSCLRGPTRGRWGCVWGMSQSVDVCYCCLRIKRINRLAFNDFIDLLLLVYRVLWSLHRSQFLRAFPPSLKAMLHCTECASCFSAFTDNTCFPSLITQVTAHYLASSLSKWPINARATVLCLIAVVFVPPSPSKSGIMPQSRRFPQLFQFKLCVFAMRRPSTSERINAPGNAPKFCIILRLSFSSVALCTKSHKAEQWRHTTLCIL